MSDASLALGGSEECTIKRKWVLEHGEEVAAYIKKWRSEHPEQVNKHVSTRRAKAAVQHSPPTPAAMERFSTKAPSNLSTSSSCNDSDGWAQALSEGLAPSSSTASGSSSLDSFANHLEKDLGVNSPSQSSSGSREERLSSFAEQYKPASSSSSTSLTYSPSYSAASQIRPHHHVPPSHSPHVDNVDKQPDYPTSPFRPPPESPPLPSDADGSGGSR